MGYSSLDEEIYRELSDDEVERILDVLAPITGIVDADAILAALTAAGWTLAPPGSRVVPEGVVETFEAINRLLSPAPVRTFDGLIRDADRACDLARGALRALAEAKP